MHLSYAEQRALEVGITIAGGASVILLDEPTAGMSQSETSRFVHLIRAATEGKTLLMVEHDMGVVFDLADRIAVLVYGELLAFDTPEAVRANARCKRPTWARGGAAAGHFVMLKIDQLHAFYGKSHVLHGVSLRVGRAKLWHCWGATARAAPPRPKPSWDWSRRRGRCFGGAGRCWAKRPSRSPDRVWAMCQRAGTFFPRSRWSKTWWLGQKHRPAAGRWSRSDMYACSRS